MNTNELISKNAEALEQKFQDKGVKPISSITYDPQTDKIYLGDGRDGIESENVVIDMKEFRKAKAFTDSGDVEKANRLKPYSNLFLQMADNRKRIIAEKIKNPAKSIRNIAKDILGASGPTATTDYDAIRNTGEMIGTVTGQEHNDEDYLAINIAEEVTKSNLKFEYLRRTSARIVAQRNLADDDVAMPLKHVYETGYKELFAYGLSFKTSRRDSDQMKLDTKADFMKQVPSAFLSAKNEDVLAILNTITTPTPVNQGNWTAFTAGIADVDASAQVQVAEEAVKPYTNGSNDYVCIMDSVAWKAYMKNLQGAYFQGRLQNEASVSTNGNKTGKLAGNSRVSYFIDDGLTPASYVLASKPQYMKHFKGITVKTSYTDPRTPAEATQDFFYEYAGFEVTEPNAVFNGLTVNA